MLWNDGGRDDPGSAWPPDSGFSKRKRLDQLVKPEIRSSHMQFGGGGRGIKPANRCLEEESNLHECAVHGGGEHTGIFFLLQLSVTITTFHEPEAPLFHRNEVAQ